MRQSVSLTTAVSLHSSLASQKRRAFASSIDESDSEAIVSEDIYTLTRDQGNLKLTG